MLNKMYDPLGVLCYKVVRVINIEDGKCIGFHLMPVSPFDIPIEWN